MEDSNIKVVLVDANRKETNGMGTAGFVLTLIGILLCWVPVLDWILWFLGFLYSFIGVFKKPRGFAIAGLILSLIDIIVLLFLIGAIIALAAASA